MKITQIRRGVFETNSSSTHSISIHRNPSNKKKDLHHELLNRYKGKKLVIDGGFGKSEFGWETETSCDFFSKLNYLIIGQQLKLNRSKIEYALKTFLMTYLKISAFSIDWEFVNRDGYIDHQSDDVPFEVNIHNSDELYDFLFDNRSYVKTGNDNQG